jgi:hypothetical protein
VGRIPRSGVCSLGFACRVWGPPLGLRAIRPDSGLKTSSSDAAQMVGTIRIPNGSLKFACLAVLTCGLRSYRTGQSKAFHRRTRCPRWGACVRGNSRGYLRSAIVLPGPKRAVGLERQVCRPVAEVKCLSALTINDEVRNHGQLNRYQ